MNEDTRELLQDLRALATDGPGEAPLHIEEQLVARFRSQKRRRKLLSWLPAVGIAAAAGILMFVWAHRDASRHTAVPVAAHAVPVRAAAYNADEDSDASFYPLPEAEALPAVENAMVVRVQLPISSLELMGVPVSEESAGASVQADLLLGQDGLARAVRLAQ